MKGEMNYYSPMVAALRSIHDRRGLHKVIKVTLRVTTSNYKDKHLNLQ